MPSSQSPSPPAAKQNGSKSSSKGKSTGSVASIGAGDSPKVAIRRSAIHGRGLFALERIARNTRIGTYEGPETQRNGAYVLWVDDAGREFGIAGKNDLRFVNHSKAPNAIFRGEELYALRGIQSDEEITFDYGEDWD